MITLSWKKHRTSSARYILLWHDKQYLVCNVWYPKHQRLRSRENASEKMHSASYCRSHYISCNVHKDMDSPLRTYFGSFWTGIRTSVFLRADLSISAWRIRTSGHQDILVWVAPEALQPDKGSTKASIITFAAQAGILPQTGTPGQQTGWSGEAMGLERRWIHMNPLYQCLAKCNKSRLEGCGWRSRGTIYIIYIYIVIYIYNLFFIQYYTDQTSWFANDYQALVKGTQFLQ